MTDIIVTWPKSRPLQSYLDELEKARKADLLINFRVPSRPDVWMGDLCYVVYDGAIRGYNDIIGVEHRDDVIDPITNKLMTPGFYVIRDPRWRPLDEPEAMTGFRGYRYKPKEGM